MDLLSSHGQQLARHMGIMLPYVADPTPQPLQAQTDAPKQGFRVMRGLSRLTNLTNNVIAQMDNLADSVATDIQSAADEIQHCMDGFTQVRDQMKTTAAEARATLNQLTNGTPMTADPTSPAPPAAS